MIFSRNSLLLNRWPTGFIVGSLLFFLLTFNNLVWGQFYNGYQMDFGRSRVQYKDFFWTYYKFDRFDTYFYLNGKELALHTAKYAAIELDNTERKLDTYLEGKIQFIIYNNLTELKESNIGLTSGTEYNIGGVTHILGNKIVLYFNGSLSDFELQIRQGIVHILLQNAIFGTNIGSQVVNSALQGFPDWYTKGLITYITEGWNTDIDNRMRNIILSGKYKKFSRLTMEEEYVTDAGHSFWWFIAEKYGENTVQNIINMTKVSRSIETAFQYELGANIKTLYGEWYQFFNDLYSDDLSGSSLPDDNLKIKGKRILRETKTRRNFTELQTSPDGAFTAFVTNETGKYKVWLQDYQTSKLKRLYTGGYKLDEKIDYSYPLLSWHPTGKILSMILENKGLIWLYFYDMDEKRWSTQNIFGFEKILDFSYSGDGKSLIFSAVQKGQSDLFLFRISSGSYEQLTNDDWDDLNPTFFDHSGKIIFSSNRVSDTLTFGEETDREMMPVNTDIFIYDLTTRSRLLRRITNTPHFNESQPLEYGKGYFSYLSDANGINNEYIGKIDSTVAFVDTAVHYRYFTNSFPITNYPQGIYEHHISPSAGRKTWIIRNKLYDNLFSDDLLPAKNLSPVALENTVFIDKVLSVIRHERLPVTVDTVIMETIPAEKKRKSFRNVLKNDTYFTIPETTTQDLKSPSDTSYMFDKQGFVAFNIPDSLRAVAVMFDKKPPEKKEKSISAPKQRNYNVEFSINQLVTQIDFSYLNQTYQPFSATINPVNVGGIPAFDINPNYSSPGLSPTFVVGATDLMEDYRIMGGLRLGLDLINKEYFVNYANLRKRLDKEFIFQRRSLEETLYSAYVTRQYTNEGFFVATWPFTRVLRLKSTFLFRNENYIFAGPDEFSISYPNLVMNWGGFKAQLIYDDTKKLGLNLYEGSRFMIFGEYNQMIDEIDRNLMVFGFDFRNYKRLHRQFIWANRIAGSTNFGTEKLMYYMGGTDQWMIPEFETETPLDYTQNWVYQALATNMRGFNQNARNGNNFIVINSEFRMPIFRYLFNRPIKSEFINNFQLVTFGDVGTAWSGVNPYDANNVLYTRYVESGPVRVKVQYQKDPLIGGFGFGARTKLLGYFLKGDLAWGIEDGKIKSSPKFYLSMSLDF